MIKIILFSLSIAFVLLVWFKTNVVYEYGKLLGIRRFGFDGYQKLIDSFEKSGSLDLHLPNYCQFLNNKYSENFFINLINCPICLSFWLSVFCAVFVGWQFILAISFLSCIFYFCSVFLLNKTSS